MSKPVAFRWKLQTPISDVGYIYDVFDYGGGEPLYTHPVKELTDEEIRALWKPMPDTKVYVSDLINFARAILRKASEK